MKTSNRLHNKISQRVLSAVLALLSTSAIALPSADAQSAPNGLSRQPAAVRNQSSANAMPDELLVTAGTTDKEEFANSIKEVHGTIVRTIGEGSMTVYVVQTERGKVEETQSKLSKDPDIGVVQRNFLFKPQQYVTPNDPYYPSQWHLAALKVQKAWGPNGFAPGAQIGWGQTLAVIDSGKNVSQADLPTVAGFDAVKNTPYQVPFGDHGDMVATLACARTNNSLCAGSIAPCCSVYPIRVADASGAISESFIIEAVAHAGLKNIRLINLSINAAPPYSLSNKQAHPIFHSYAEWYHNSRGGLMFLAAGNDGKEDSSWISPNIIVVSALTPSYTKASFSNYGLNVWFTAPGVNMVCSDSKGRVVSVSGTSFSAPCMAAVAAMVWGARPSLRNTEVERILRGYSYQPSGAVVTHTKSFGFGLINAEQAVNAAKSGYIPNK